MCANFSLLGHISREVYLILTIRRDFVELSDTPNLPKSPHHKTQPGLPDKAITFLSGSHWITSI